MLVWYTREDGEVVSDYQEIDLKKCLTNPVSLEWSAARAGPGDNVDLAITAEPQSLCSLGECDSDPTYRAPMMAGSQGHRGMN